MVEHAHITLRRVDKVVLNTKTTIFKMQENKWAVFFKIASILEQNLLEIWNTNKESWILVSEGCFVISIGKDESIVDERHLYVFLLLFEGFYSSSKWCEPKTESIIITKTVKTSEAFLIDPHSKEL